MASKETISAPLAWDLAFSQNEQRALFKNNK